MRTFRRLCKKPSRAAGLRQKARFTPDSLQLSALLSNDNVYNSSVPESFTIGWSTRIRNTGYIAGEGQEEANQRNAGRADVRKHGELFIKPSSRRISDRMRSHVTIHAANTKLYFLVYPLKFHILMEKNSWWYIYTGWEDIGSLGDYYEC